MIINQIGAGGSANVKVVGGTVQPVSPAENTLWVNTAVEITDYQFTNAVPTTRSNGSNLVGGEVYFALGASSSGEMNISSGGVFMVYPVSVYQYVSGTWELKSAKTYTEGAWHDWETIYWKDGTAYFTLINSSGASDMTIPKKTNLYDVNYYSLMKVDLTNISTLTFTVTWSSSTTYAHVRIGAWKNQPGTNAASMRDYAVGANLANSSGTNEVKTLDVSSLDGEYFIGIGARNTSSSPATYQISCSELIGG